MSVWADIQDFKAMLCTVKILVPWSSAGPGLLDFDSDAKFYLLCQTHCLDWPA